MEGEPIVFMSCSHAIVSMLLAEHTAYIGGIAAALRLILQKQIVPLGWRILPDLLGIKLSHHSGWLEETSAGVQLQSETFQLHECQRNRMVK